MKRGFLLLLFIPLLLFSFCEDLKEDLSPYISSFSAEVIMLNLVPPQIENLDFGIKDETSILVFLADASSIDNFDEFPILGATVNVVNIHFGSLSFIEEGDGLYTITSLDAGNESFAYIQGDLYTIKINVGGEEYTMTTYPPPTLTIRPPETIPAMTPLQIDLSDKGYDHYVVMVIDQEGVVTYSSLDLENLDAETLYELAMKDAEQVIEIPGSAFPREGIFYAIGIAGLKESEEGEFSSNINTILSNFMAGSAAFTAVYTEIED